MLLVIGVLRSAETRALLSEAIGSYGHRLVQAGSCEQAEVLLKNGLEPDLVVYES